MDGEEKNTLSKLPNRIPVSHLACQIPADEKLLMEMDFNEEIKIIFKKGQRIEKHQAPFPITVQIVHGFINIGVHGTIHQLESGN